MRVFRSLLIGLLVSWSPLGVTEARSQDEDSPPPPPPPSGSVPPGGAAANKEPAPPVLPKKKMFTPAQVQKECRKYEGLFVAYFDRIYKIEQCKRRELVSNDDDANPLLNSKKVITIDAETVAMIPEGKSIGGDVPPKVNCLRLEGRYILTRGEEVYYVEKCKKHLLPDWDTYLEHAQKRGKRSLEIFELSEKEVQAIKSGPELKSVLDSEYKTLLSAEKNVDIIPLQEACKGLNGKYVSYYSKIYKIDRCRKQSVDPEVFVLRNPNYKLVEMSSEQWVSIPNGKALQIK